MHTAIHILQQVSVIDEYFRILFQYSILCNVTIYNSTIKIPICIYWFGCLFVYYSLIFCSHFMLGMVVVDRIGIGSGCYPGNTRHKVETDPGSITSNTEGKKGNERTNSMMPHWVHCCLTAPELGLLV